MRWVEARIRLQEMLKEYGEDWPEKYRQAVEIGIERIQEVEDLELTGEEE